jgi:hypothetical protein
VWRRHEVVVDGDVGIGIGIGIGIGEHRLEFATERR